MEIFAERHQNRIHLFSPYDPGVVYCAKEILGHGIVHNKDGSFKCWTFPLDWGTCQDLRTAFGTNLIIGPKLWRWAKLEKRRKATARVIAGMTAKELARVEQDSPRLCAALRTRTYQQVGAAFIAHTRAALLADEPGLGKTLQAMAAVVEADIKGTVLVLAPQTAIESTWAEELARWLPEDDVFVCSGDKGKRTRTIEECLAFDSDNKWLLCNHEMLRVIANKGSAPTYPKLLSTQWASVIVDESQRLLITRTGLKEMQSLMRQGAGRLKVARGGLRLAMSGTPYRGKIENMWGTLNWLFPDKYTSYNRWVETWFSFFIDSGNNDMILDGIAEHKQSDFYAELDSIILRRTKREVAPDMPAKLYAGWPLDATVDGSPMGVWLPMGPVQRKAYEQMQLHALAMLDDGELMANGVLAEMTRLKQFATSYARLEQYTRRVHREIDGIEQMIEEPYTVAIPQVPSNKWTWLCEWLEEREFDIRSTGQGKVIIASQFSKIVDLLQTELANKYKIRAPKITGDITGDARAQAKRDFQDPKGPRIILLSTKAGGVSLTLDQGDDIIFFDETWDPDDQTQVEDRADRVSRSNHQVTVWYARSLGTIEESIATDNATLDAMQSQLLDGRRGVERAKQLLAIKPTRSEK